MKNRTNSKHIKQWRQPFHDSIAHYNATIHHCKRWRNRRKAQRMWTQSINRYFKAKLARH